MRAVAIAVCAAVLTAAAPISHHSIRPAGTAAVHLDHIVYEDDPPVHTGPATAHVSVVVGDVTHDVALASHVLHPGLPRDVRLTTVHDMMTRLGVSDLSSQRALEDLLPVSSGPPTVRAHIEFIVEDPNTAADDAHQAADPASRGALLHHYYMDLTDDDGPHLPSIAATFCAKYLPFDGCEAYVASEASGSLQRALARPYDPRANLPKAAYSSSDVPACVLLREGFNHSFVASQPDVALRYRATTTTTAAAAAAAPLQTVAAALAARVSVLFVVIHFHHSPKAEYVERMITRAATLAAGPRFSVDFHLFVTEDVLWVPLKWIQDLGPTFSFTTHVESPMLKEDFAWVARQLVLDAVDTDRYDVYIFSEDDHDIHQAHIDALLAWSAVPWMPDDWIVGGLQFEWSDGRRHLLNGALMHNDAYRVYHRHGHEFLVAQNIHQAGFLATHRHMKLAQQRGCLHRQHVRHWSYQHIEAADTELYFRCGLMKVVPLTPLPGLAASSPGAVLAVDPFMIHHLPDKYVREGTTEARLDKFYLTDARLLRWISAACPAAPQTAPPARR